MDKFWPLLAILEFKKFSTKKILGGYLSHIEAQLRAKKYISNGQGWSTGTDVRRNIRTNAQEWIFRFLPESKDIRGTNNYKRGNFARFSWEWKFLFCRFTSLIGEGNISVLCKKSPKLAILRDKLKDFKNLWDEAMKWYFLHSPDQDEQFKLCFTPA